MGEFSITIYMKAKDNAHRIENAVNNSQKRQEAEQAAAQEAAYQADISSGKTYYVNASNGSNRNDGTSPATAIKDLQKTLDLLDDDDDVTDVWHNWDE